MSSSAGGDEGYDVGRASGGGRAGGTAVASLRALCLPIQMLLVAASPLVAVAASPSEIKPGFVCIRGCAPGPANGGQLAGILHKLCCHKLQLSFLSFVSLSAAVIGSNTAAWMGPRGLASHLAELP